MIRTNLMQRCSVRIVRRAALLMAMLAASAVGCSKGSDRASVSGKVTFDGQPVASGQIAFEPRGTGRLGIAQIADGAYKMAAEQGPTPGEYVVRITANRPTGAKTAGGRGGDAQVDVYEQFIPAKFNDRSELKVQIDDAAEVVRDFELTTK
jgi:hypothetical protein